MWKDVDAGLLKFWWYKWNKDMVTCLHMFVFFVLIFVQRSTDNYLNKYKTMKRSWYMSFASFFCRTKKYRKKKISKTILMCHLQPTLFTYKCKILMLLQIILCRVSEKMCWSCVNSASDIFYFRCFYLSTKWMSFFLTFVFFSSFIITNTIE